MKQIIAEIQSQTFGADSTARNTKQLVAHSGVKESWVVFPSVIFFVAMLQRND